MIDIYEKLRIYSKILKLKKMSLSDIFRRELDTVMATRILPYYNIDYHITSLSEVKHCLEIYHTNSEIIKIYFDVIFPTNTTINYETTVDIKGIWNWDNLQNILSLLMGISPHNHNSLLKQQLQSYYDANRTL